MLCYILIGSMFNTAQLGVLSLCSNRELFTLPHFSFIVLTQKYGILGHTLQSLQCLSGWDPHQPTPPGAKHNVLNLVGHTL